MSQDSLHLPGPYFGFLVANGDQYLNRRGKIGRIAGVKPDCHRHPDVLRVSDTLLSSFLDCFKMAEPRFAYHGYTEYQGDALNRLEDCLQRRLERIQMDDESPIPQPLSNAFLEACTTGISASVLSQRLNDAMAGSLLEILVRIRQAKRDGKTLLVLGV